MKNRHGGHTDAAADIARHLNEAIRETQEGLRRVAIWADALRAFSQPIPEYRPNDRFVLRQATYEGPGNSLHDHSRDRLGRTPA